jgi:hypothetical protein
VSEIVTARYFAFLGKGVLTGVIYIYICCGADGDLIYYISDRNFGTKTGAIRLNGAQIHASKKSNFVICVKRLQQTI